MKLFECFKTWQRVFERSHYHTVYRQFICFETHNELISFKLSKRQNARIFECYRVFNKIVHCSMQDSSTVFRGAWTTPNSFEFNFMWIYLWPQNVLVPSVVQWFEELEPPRIHKCEANIIIALSHTYTKINSNVQQCLCEKIWVKFSKEHVGSIAFISEKVLDYNG